MITTTYAKFSHYNAEGVTVQIVTMMGLSTDSKPTDSSIGNGSAFIEMNTSKLYFYDAAGESWKEWGADATSVQSAAPSSLNLSPLTRPGLTTQVIEPEIEPDVVDEQEEDEQDAEAQEAEPEAGADDET